MSLVHAQLAAILLAAAAQVIVARTIHPVLATPTQHVLDPGPPVTPRVLTPVAAQTTTAVSLAQAFSAAPVTGPHVPHIPASLVQALAAVPVTARRVVVTTPVVVLQTIAVPITTVVSLVRALTVVQVMGHHAPPTTSVAALPVAVPLRAHAPAINAAATTRQWMWELSSSSSWLLYCS